MGYDWLAVCRTKATNINGAIKAFVGVQLTAKLAIQSPTTFRRLYPSGWYGARRRHQAQRPRSSTTKDHDTGVSPVFAGGIEYAITPGNRNPSGIPVKLASLRLVIRWESMIRALRAAKLQRGTGWMTEELTEEEHASPAEAAKVGNAVGFIMRPVRNNALPVRQHSGLKFTL